MTTIADDVIVIIASRVGIVKACDMVAKYIKTGHLIPTFDCEESYTDTVKKYAKKVLEHTK